MDEIKRVLRRANAMPAKFFSEWQQGVIYGVTVGVRDERLMSMIAESVREYERVHGPIDLQKVA